MAELLLPLQALLTVAGGGKPLEILHDYATGLDERDQQHEMQTPSVRLLTACKELFDENAEPKKPDDSSFIPTDKLISLLVKRQEEPWFRWNKGSQITREALANLLRPYGIRSSRDQEQTARGYFAFDFEDAWDRYVAPTPPL